MRCGNCGRKLTDAAQAVGYCPSCGTHIAMEGAEAALGVAVPRMTTITEDASVPPLTLPDASAPLFPPSARTRSASYSPNAGQPAVPSDEGRGMPTQAPYGRTPSGYIPEVAQTRTPSAAPNYPPPPIGRTPSGYPQGSSPIVVDSASPVVYVTRRNSGGGVLFTLILLLVLLAAGVSTLYIAGTQGSGPLATYFGNATPKVAAATSTPAPTPTPRPPTATPRPTATPLPPTATPPTVPTPPVGARGFMSSDGTFGLNYPTPWTAAATTKGSITTYTFNSADQAEYLQIIASDNAIGTADITTYLQQFVSGTTGTSGFRVIEDANPAKIGVNTWSRAQAVYQIGTIQQNIIGYAINHGTKGYLLFYTAPASSFNILPGSNFDVMVNSFTFLH